MDTNKMIELLKKNWKYLGGAVVFIIIIVVLIQVSAGFPKGDAGNNTTAGIAMTSEGDTSEGDTSSGNALNLKQQLSEQKITTIEDGTETYHKIEELVNTYFTAMAANDVDTLKGILNQVTTDDEQEVLNVSNRTESYENVKLRVVKSGIEADTYVAFVSYEGKYVGVDTLAPGLISFYICTNQDGSLYIYNNLDDDTKLYVYTLREEDEEVEALRKEVENAYTKALDSDATLREFVEGLQNGAQATATPEPTKEPEVTATPEPTKEPEVTATPEPTVTPEPEKTEAPSGGDVSSAGVVQAVDNVNVRNMPEQTADTIGSLVKGQTATRLGTEGEWTKIQYKGTEGYVKTEYLKVAESGAGASVSEGSTTSNAETTSTFKITAKETVNIRSSMSESADRIGVAYAGDTFDCVMAYQEGWSKIKYNGQVGYVRTEYFEKQ